MTCGVAIRGDVPGVSAGGGRGPGGTMEVLTLAVVCPEGRPPMPSSPITAAAVAITERDGPQYGLAALGAIVGIERSHLWHAALADNLRRLGRTAEAAEELETAAALAPAEGERRLLLSRLLDVRSEPA